MTPFPASFVRLSTALATALLAACASTGGLAPQATPMQADAIAAFEQRHVPPFPATPESRHAR